RGFMEDDRGLPSANPVRAGRGSPLVSRVSQETEKREGRRLRRRPGRVGSGLQKTKMRTRTAANSCAIRHTVVVHESPVAVYAPRNRANVTKKPPTPIRTRAAITRASAAAPPPATASTEIEIRPVSRATRPNTRRL